MVRWGHSSAIQNKPSGNLKIHSQYESRGRQFSNALTPLRVHGSRVQCKVDPCVKACRISQTCSLVDLLFGVGRYMGSWLGK